MSALVGAAGDAAQDGPEEVSWYNRPVDLSWTGGAISRSLPKWVHYGGSVVAVAMVMLFRQYLAPWLGSHHPFLLLLAAVMIVSWYSGFGPGLLTTVLGTCTAWYLFGDANRGFVLDSTDDVLGFGLSLISGTAISALNETRIRAQRRAITRLDLVNETNEQLRVETAERIRQQDALRVTQEQLFEAQKLESVGRLAGGVAHDFNNLLMVILGYTELTETSLPPDAKEQAYMLCIRRAGERAAELTAQLLSYGCKQEMTLEIIDLNDILTEVKPLLAPLLNDNVEVVFVQAQGLWKVESDREQLKQIVLNLGINASDAMPHGGKLVIEVGNAAVGVGDVPPLTEILPGEYVMLSVTDTGVGMTLEVRDRIFEPFFTTKSMGDKRAGLGLAACYGLIKQFHGHIKVRSQPGKGADFHIYLPRAKEAEPEGTTAA